MRIINQTKNIVLADKVEVAHNFFQRMKGLLGRSSIAEGEALVIKPGNSIHTFFMRFPIDVIFADKENRIVGIIPNMKPWRLSRVYFRASYIIELKAGTPFQPIGGHPSSQSGGCPFSILSCNLGDTLSFS